MAYALFGPREDLKLGNKQSSFFVVFGKPQDSTESWLTISVFREPMRDLKQLEAIESNNL
jgi:hypothetical protein